MSIIIIDLDGDIAITNEAIIYINEYGYLELNRINYKKHILCRDIDNSIIVRNKCQEALKNNKTVLDLRDML